eukprot:scaffold115_cov304-Prasinococcus_capsulatus_cf.AAC.2
MGIEDPRAFTELLDSESSPAFRQGVTAESFLKDLDRSKDPRSTLPSGAPRQSLTAMRMLHYDNIFEVAEEQAQSVLGDHTDSTMLTVAPRASMAALEVLPFQLNRHKWQELEHTMADCDCVVFPGDCLARHTLNYYPALMHRPSVKAMAAACQLQAEAYLARCVT